MGLFEAHLLLITSLINLHAHTESTNVNSVVCKRVILPPPQQTAFETAQLVLSDDAHLFPPSLIASHLLPFGLIFPRGAEIGNSDGF